MNILIKLMSIVALIIAPHISNKEDKISYNFGVVFGAELKSLNIDSIIQPNDFLKGISDIRNLSSEDVEKSMLFVQDFMKEKQLELERKEIAFFKANQSQDGVVELPSGIQYKIISQGQGVFPNDSDLVTIAWEITTLDGREKLYDNTNKPVDMKFNESILSILQNNQILSVGGKIKVFFPGGVVQNNAVIANVQLLNIKN